MSHQMAGDFLNWKYAQIRAALRDAYTLIVSASDEKKKWLFL